MKIAIYSKVFNPGIAKEIQYFFDKIGEYPVELHIHQHFYQEIENNISLAAPPKTFHTAEDISADIKLLICLGGDGTILEGIAMVKNSAVPIVGINLGRLGFLASIKKENIDEALAAIFKGEYTLDRRTLIQVNSELPLFGADNYALNDITIHKRDDASMMLIHTYLNNELVCSYWANGLIVATPTGSTAYSLSCGGPVIFPASDTLILTPIAPHNLNVRPLVFPDNFELSLQIEGRSAKYLVSCDSKTEIVDNFVKLKISKANFEINLLRLNNESFLNTLRNKLHWGIDARNY